MTGSESLAEPRASIVVVASSSCSFLERCLEQLARLETAVPFETVVILNGVSSDESLGLPSLPRAARTRIESSDVNLGLAGALNFARTFARGEFLVVLHDDAKVEPGWLDALVESADREPDAGAVGSLVLDESRRVTSAGWQLLPDGRTRPSLFTERPPADQFASARAVDYCQSCSLLVRATTWDQMGGADDRFFPLYYVDADLCLAIRARGQRVLIEPRSVVIHPGGGSGTDRDFALFVAERNRLLMLAKWGELIRSHEPGSGRTFSVPEADVPAQECHGDLELRRRTHLARRDALGADYEADLRQRLVARERELDQSRQDAEELRAAVAGAASERESLRRRSETLAIIEESRWWRLHERLTPLLRTAAAVRRALRPSRAR